MAVRVMYVLDHLRVGGAQTHLVETIARLDRRFEPAVCALKLEGELRAPLEARGVRLFDGGLGATLKGWSGARVLGRLVRLFRRERVDIAHAYLFHPNVLTPIAARLARTPAVVVSKRSLDRYPGLAERYACKLGNALADRVMINAAAIGRFVTAEEGCPPDRMVLIPNGVGDDLLDFTPDGARARRELGLSPGDRVVGAVSRLAWKKGIRHLLEAVPRVLESVPAAFFLIVGDGPLRADLEARARDLRIDDRVRFLGTRGDVLELLGAVDVFVLPSVVEGMSNALLEAMAMGRPVVATDVGGNPEVMVDGQTGFVVPPADPDRLAAAVAKVLLAPELGEAMGAAARQRIRDHYRVDLMVRRIEALYDALLPEARRR
jgi:glycosyltransferase involved in cell wall biosynthesis